MTVTRQPSETSPASSPALNPTATWGWPGLTLLFLLAFLNWGLYTRLQQKPLQASLQIPYQQTFAENPLGAWRLTGVWEVRDHSLVTVKPGKALIPLRTEGPFMAQVTLGLPDAGGSASLLFMHQDNKESQMVVLTRSAGQARIGAGFVDARGNVHLRASVKIPDQQSGTLAIKVQNNRYGVFWEGEQVLKNLDLQHQAGLVALSGSTPQVTFSDFQVAEFFNLLKPNPTGLQLKNFRSVSGKWQQDKAAVVQMNENEYDTMLVNRKPLSESFQMNVTLRHRKGQGGGVMLGTQLGNKSGGYLVRFNDQGSGILWGKFNDKGVYEPIGYLSKVGNGPAYTLSVSGQLGQMAVRLDGQMLFTAPYQKGTYAALTTSRSQVEFSRFILRDVP